MSDWPSPIPSGAFVNVRKYRAVGDGVTDDTSAIQRALDSELYVSFGYPPTARTYLVSSQLVMRSGQILDFAGSTVVLPAASTNFSTGVFNLTGSFAGGPRSLASNAAEFAATITLTAGSVAALSLVVGDFLIIKDDDDRAQHVEVTGIAGEVITLMERLAWDFTTAKNSLVYRYTTASLKTATIRDLTIDGTLNTGTGSTGIYFLDTLRPRLERVTVKGFKFLGILVFQSHAPVLRDLRFVSNGNASGADIQVYFASGISAEHVYSEKSTSFGPTFISCTHGRLSDFRISDPATRLFKLQNSAQFTAAGFHLTTHVASVTGLGVVVNSRRNIFHGVHIYGADEGLWVDGPYNEFWGVKIAASATRDIAFNSALCVDCLVQGDFSLTGLADNGTGNRFIQTVG